MNVLWEEGLLSTHIIIRIAVSRILVSIRVPGLRNDWWGSVAGGWGHVDMVWWWIICGVIGRILIMIYRLGWGRWKVIAFGEVSRICAVYRRRRAVAGGRISRVFMF
jgi:hypothetical protein